ncbi:MAG: tRNA (adenosine(37)-N6)-threonylcarbamoyltransferase complex ATPase subunit type 1 TsaE [Clostridiales bacterium]|jgi:tRNA threonylcarbamoyladenosine biosynthesis protein TsaE|nr:tRNA (adenosine(37)-N6)-threonylcarbamoyltransferase complex ATPase subunit type 1 TsaE [Clostridiales bacterium]
MTLIDTVSKSPKDTALIAAAFGADLKKGDIVLLDGLLGAGKTHFVKGIAEALRIPDIITSPTFTIMNVYYGGALPLFHLDMYRVADADELFETGVEDFINSGEGITAIEWNKYDGFIGGGRVFRVGIERIDDERRKISISID